MPVKPEADKDWKAFCKEAKFSFLFAHLLLTKDIK